MKVGLLSSLPVTVPAQLTRGLGAVREGRICGIRAGNGRGLRIGVASLGSVGQDAGVEEGGGPLDQVLVLGSAGGGASLGADGLPALDAVHDVRSSVEVEEVGGLAFVGRE